MKSGTGRPPPAGPVCPVPRDADLSGVSVAMRLSWYDRDRNVEAPQHVCECLQDPAVPGYVDDAPSRGAALKVDFDDGRFVFFYCPVEF